MMVCGAALTNLPPHEHCLTWDRNTDQIVNRYLAPWWYFFQYYLNCEEKSFEMFLIEYGLCKIQWWISPKLRKGNEKSSATFILISNFNFNFHTGNYVHGWITSVVKLEGFIGFPMNLPNSYVKILYRSSVDFAFHFFTFIGINLATSTILTWCHSTNNQWLSCCHQVSLKNNHYSVICIYIN